MPTIRLSLLGCAYPKPYNVVFPACWERVSGFSIPEPTAWYTYVPYSAFAPKGCPQHRPPSEIGKGRYLRNTLLNLKRKILNLQKSKVIFSESAPSSSIYTPEIFSLTIFLKSYYNNYLYSQKSLLLNCTILYNIYLYFSVIYLLILSAIYGICI